MKKATIIALFALIAVFTIHAAQPMDFYAKKQKRLLLRGVTAMPWTMPTKR